MGVGPSRAGADLLLQVTCAGYDAVRSLNRSYGPFQRHSSAEGFEPIARLQTLEQTALAACKGRVLDVGAGAGRHSVLLRDAGFDVISIDIESTLVDLMKRRGLEKAYQCDIFALDHGTFDTVVFLQRTIGLSGTLERLYELLDRLKHRLDPRGQILLDSTSPRFIASPTRYAGEETCQLKYRSMLGKPFPWLRIDFSVLSICARAAGYEPDLLARGPAAGDYLAKLVLTRPV